MSISGSMFNAYSGLVAAARSTEAVSNNVSNALTEGYGRREVDLVAATTGGRGTGVRVASVYRDIDQIAIADRRLAQAALGEQSVSAGAYIRLEGTIGIPGETGSLSDLVAGLEAALVSAQSRPDIQVRQQNVLYAANDLIAKVNQVSEASQDLRMEADSSIGSQVDLLNSSLAAIAELNLDIRSQYASGRNMNGLMDQRQVLVDQISEIIPIKIYPRDNGQIAVISAKGAMLLDGLAAEFGFTEVGLITAGMSIGSGALSGLTMNGKSISIEGSSSLISGGSLAAQFNLRDNLAPFASEQIDAFARNLIERFETSGLDASLAIGDPGLFTDEGQAFDATLEVGIAGRLAINALVDPDAGGELWRLRDGLGATVAGDEGDRTLLTAFIDVIELGQTPQSGQFSAGNSDLSDLAGDLVSLNSAARLDAEQAEIYAQSRFQELYLVELEGGVDTDQEMQKLLLIETAYAANARVISTIEEMLQTILEL
jgi:flagellar hook-associated protein 1 FlgK